LTHPLVQAARHGTDSITTLVERFYASDGPLVASGFEVRPQQREMSLRFAAQIDAEDPSVGFIESPCGVGKSLAYLVPGVFAALRAERRWSDAKRRELPVEDPQPTGRDYPAKFLVSTANIALQAQITRKDIPALARMLGIEIRASLMKSRSNYICRDALSEAGRDLPEFNALRDWLHQGGDGDRENLTWDASQVWPRVSRGADECVGDSCDHWEGGAERVCCWRAAIESWPSAHVLVANHHWASLVRGISTVGYAVDEGHELEDALRGVQGRALWPSKLVALATRYVSLTSASDARSEAERRRSAEASMSAAAEALFHVVEARVAAALATKDDDGQRDPVPLPRRWVRAADGPAIEGGFRVVVEWRDAIIDAALEEGCALEDGYMKAGSLPPDLKAARKVKALCSLANRAIEAARLYAAAVCGRAHPDWRNREGWAIWAEREKDRRGNERLTVNFTPADVAPAFGSLFMRYPRMVVTSATLPAFDTMRLALGCGVEIGPANRPLWPSIYATGTGRMRGHTLDTEDDAAQPYAAVEVEAWPTTPDPLDDSIVTVTSSHAPAPVYEVRLPSPYPLAQQAVLVIPRGPLPTDPDAWRPWAVARVLEAVEASRGGALILATSTRQMRAYAAALREDGRWRVFMQGDAGRGKVVADFRADRDSVLVATRSMFQGIDVAGDSLRLVVIDRVPFGSNDDPTEVAIGDLLSRRSRGGSPWLLRQVPMAAMALVQGLGRLIRSQEDRGGAVILDGRVMQSGSGFRAIRRALPPFRVADMDGMRKFFSGLT
jgi:ATP-dependent DNA helicase DinG